MKSKVTEMAVFCVGVGVLLIALLSYITFILAPRPGKDVDLNRYFILIAPGVLAIALGAWIAIGRSKLAIRTATILIGAFFVLIGFIPFSIPTLAFGLLVNYVLWPAQNRAINELNGVSNEPPKIDPRWLTSIEDDEPETPSKLPT